MGEATAAQIQSSAGDEDLIQIIGMHKWYGDFHVLKDLNLAVKQGERIVICGPSGSGKSTLVRILAGVMNPTRGDVTLTVQGVKIDKERRPMHIGVVAPYLNLYDAFTPRENLRFIARARGMSDYTRRIEKVLDEVFLLTRADDLVGTFSSGMKQRMRFAFALFSHPAVLLLDEPTANLDSDGVDMVERLTSRANRNGQIVIVATNDAREAEACDEIICVEEFL